MFRRWQHATECETMPAYKSEMLRDALTKVPEITLVFWIVKIAATTLGETGGDSVTMTLNWGGAISLERQFSLAR